MWGTEEDEGGPELCRPGTVTQLPPINCTSRGRGEHAAQGTATKKVLRSKEEGEPSWPRPPSSLGLLPQPLLSAEAPQRVAGEGRDREPSGAGSGGKGPGSSAHPTRAAHVFLRRSPAAPSHKPESRRPETSSCGERSPNADFIFSLHIYTFFDPLMNEFVALGDYRWQNGPPRPQNSKSRRDRVFCVLRILFLILCQVV